MKWKTILAIVISLTVTPLIIFISPSNELYFKNQIDLGNNIAVLYPFFYLFLATIALGIILHIFSRYRAVRYVLWFYYLAGPFYLIYTALRKAPVSTLESPVGAAIGIGILVILAIFAARKLSVGPAVKFFVYVGILLLVFDSYLFISNIDSNQPNGKTPDLAQSPAKTAKNDNLAKSEKMPNIYLFILDEFQSDVFDLALSKEVKDSLGGFTYFPENTTLFGRTRMSIPSIFLGVSYSFKRPQKEYILSSFTSKSSILYWLKSAGYSTYAYVFQSFNRLDLFDNVTKTTPENKYIPASVFNEIWAFNNLPLFISKRMMTPERLEKIKNRNFVPKNMALSSYKGFLQYLDEEKELPVNNRFTFIYSFIPHYPYIFKDDCSLNSDFRETSPLSQSKCATKMIMRFIKTLKKLNRFDDSMIIITADHGARYESRDGKLYDVDFDDYYTTQWSRARSRALLMVKLPNTPDTEGLITSDFQSSLLDIAPTIASSLKELPPIEYDGIPLGPKTPQSFERKRRYYYFDTKDPYGWTDKMTEFIIENGEIKKIGDIKIENNSKPSNKPYFRKRP